MSADNAIYIREMPNGRFKVDCISSLYPEELTDSQIDECFREDLPEFDSVEQAWEEEERIQEEYEDQGWPIEYGSEILLRKSR